MLHYLTYKATSVTMVSSGCLFHRSWSCFNRDKYICQDILIKSESDLANIGAKAANFY